MSTVKVWFVTGASKGLGLALVKELLRKGYKVAATSGNVNELKKTVNITSESCCPCTHELGFEHPQSFNKFFKKQTGQSPVEFHSSFN